jgi:hypothetical protein
MSLLLKNISVLLQSDYRDGQLGSGVDVGLGKDLHAFIGSQHHEGHTETTTVSSALKNIVSILELTSGSFRP